MDFRTYSDFMHEEEHDMKKDDDTIDSTEDPGQEEVIRCVGCGSVIGYYKTGSAGTTRCPACKASLKMDLREDRLILTKIRPRVKARTV